ncbi:hypothetical protein WR25_17186 [Diploscapter pachys]|uniref:Roller-3 N-terminal domain-containing protein n=1 Tax=Diploscapter pachys TaxID=2018661 RepID=A0A2A2L0I8_9BILA|nr:hypothetical protein WR25_17186 [Diploscapter pachys]
MRIDISFKIKQIILLVLLLLEFCVICKSATVLSAAVNACQEQCNERNLALPLERGETSWRQEWLQKCNFQCRVKSCQTGCRYLEKDASLVIPTTSSTTQAPDESTAEPTEPTGSPNTPKECLSVCTSESLAIDSCEQGCRAVFSQVMKQLQTIVNEARVEIETADERLKLKWMFSESNLPTVQEVAAEDVLWFAQTRPVMGSNGWRWSALPMGAFRNGSLSSEVVTPQESSPNIQIRLALAYHNHVVVSKHVHYQTPLELYPNQISIEKSMQIDGSKQLVCWEYKGVVTTFQLTLSSTDGTEMTKFDLGSNSHCNLFANLSSANCCNLKIEALDGEGKILKETSTNFTISENSESSLSDKDLIILANATHLMHFPPSVDYVMEQPPVVFEVPDLLSEGEEITAISGMNNHRRLLVGTSKGNIFMVDPTKNPNETSKDERIFMVRPTKENGPISYVNYDPVQNITYAVEKEKGVVRCVMSKECSLVPNSDQANPTKQLVVDSINGFIYLLNTDHTIKRSTLWRLNATAPAEFIDLTDISGSIFLLDLVSQKVTHKDGEFTEVDLMRSYYNRIFWSRKKCGDTPNDEICFYSEKSSNETKEGDLHFSRYLLTQKFMDFTFFKSQKLSKFINSPPSLTLLCTDSTAKLQWTSPPLLPFQGKLDPQK